MKCLFTKIQSNIAIWQYIAIHSNTIILCNMAFTRIVSPLVCMCVYTYVCIHMCGVDVCMLAHVYDYVCEYVCM